MNQNHINIRNLTIASLFAAIIYIGTNYLKVPLPGGQEYIHLGDGFIFVSAMLLPLPYSMAASAVGASLADILGGYGIWAPYTIVIKALMALCVYPLKRSEGKFKTVYAMTAATLINTLGYYLAGIIIYKNIYTGLFSMLFTLLQSLMAVAVYLIVSPLVRKIAGK